MFRRVYLHNLIYIITMSVNLSLYREKVGTFKNHNLTRFRNNYRHFKYYLYDIDIAFGVISFSCSILTPISSFGILVRNTIKIFLFSRFREIKGVFVTIFVFTFCVSFFFKKSTFKCSLESEQHFCP